MNLSTRSVQQLLEPGLIPSESESIRLMQTSYQQLLDTARLPLELLNLIEDKQIEAIADGGRQLFNLPESAERLMQESFARYGSHSSTFGLGNEHPTNSTRIAIQQSAEAEELAKKVLKTMLDKQNLSASPAEILKSRATQELRKAMKAL